MRLLKLCLRYLLICIMLVFAEACSSLGKLAYYAPANDIASGWQGRIEKDPLNFKEYLLTTTIYGDDSVAVGKITLEFETRQIYLIGLPYLPFFPFPINNSSGYLFSLYLVSLKPDWTRRLQIDSTSDDQRDSMYREKGTTLQSTHTLLLAKYPCVPSGLASGSAIQCMLRQFRALICLARKNGSKKITGVIVFTWMQFLINK